jgi:predicted RNase H-like nuclease
MMTSPTVVGIDGCRGGWVAVSAQGGSFTGAAVYPKIEVLTSDVAQADMLAIDLPLSFPVDGSPRRAETAARKFLGKQWVSVFLTPPREVLAAPNYRAACRVAQAAIGKKISRQAYGLGKRILELTAYLEKTKDGRLHEVHPEISFRLLAEGLGKEITAPKKSWTGFHERVEVLEAVGMAPPRAPIPNLRGVGIDDLLDACAAAWSASRIFVGNAQPFPEDVNCVAERAPNGQPGVIWA